jgi:predicted phage-related endonuclease
MKQQLSKDCKRVVLEGEHLDAIIRSQRGALDTGKLKEEYPDIFERLRMKDTTVFEIKSKKEVN